MSAEIFRRCRDDAALRERRAEYDDFYASTRRLAIVAIICGVVGVVLGLAALAMEFMCLA